MSSLLRGAWFPGLLGHSAMLRSVLRGREGASRHLALNAADPDPGSIPLFPNIGCPEPARSDPERCRVWCAAPNLKQTQRRAVCGEVPREASDGHSPLPGPGLLIRGLVSRQGRREWGPARMLELGLGRACVFAAALARGEDHGDEQQDEEQQRGQHVAQLLEEVRAALGHDDVDDAAAALLRGVCGRGASGAGAPGTEGTDGEGPVGPHQHLGLGPSRCRGSFAAARAAGAAAGAR